MTKTSIPETDSDTWVQSSRPNAFCDQVPVAQLVKNRLQCGRPGFNLWVGKIPWRRERLPTPVFWPGEFHGVAKSQTRLSDFHSLASSHPPRGSIRVSLWYAVVRVPSLWCNKKDYFVVSSVQFSSVQLLSRVRLFSTPWIAARQASLSITISRSSRSEEHTSELQSP